MVSLRVILEYLSTPEQKMSEIEYSISTDLLVHCALSCLFVYHDVLPRPNVIPSVTTWYQISLTSAVDQNSTTKDSLTVYCHHHNSRIMDEVMYAPISVAPAFSTSAPLAQRARELEVLSSMATLTQRDDVTQRVIRVFHRRS